MDTLSTWSPREPWLACVQSLGLCVFSMSPYSSERAGPRTRKGQGSCPPGWSLPGSVCHPGCGLVGKGDGGWISYRAAQRGILVGVNLTLSVKVLDLKIGDKSQLLVLRAVGSPSWVSGSLLCKQSLAGTGIGLEK